MQANLPRSWWSLPPSEREALKKALSDNCYDLVAKEEAELQVIWIKLACMILHEVFGFGEKRLLRFVAAWKRMYRRNERQGTKQAQTEWLDREMAKCFPKGGFPDERIEEMKNTRGKG